MKKNKRACTYYVNEQQDFLFRLICKYYGINASKKINEMIESFNKVYSFDFLNESYLGRWIANECNKPWAIGGEGQGLGEGGDSLASGSRTLNKVDLKKMFDLKDDILFIQSKGNKIERYRGRQNNTMTNLFEGSVKWEGK